MRVSLFAHHLHQHALLALAIELRVEDTLPRTEVKLAIGDRQNHLMVDQRRLQVRVAVILAGW